MPTHCTSGAIMPDMPTGQVTRRLESDGFKNQWSGKMAIEWLEWQAYQQQMKSDMGTTILRKELELVAFQLTDSVPKHKLCINFTVSSCFSIISCIAWHMCTILADTSINYIKIPWDLPQSKYLL